MNYAEWEASVPGEITGDTLWKLEAYRLALFAAAIGWFDVTKLMQDKRTLDLADQLYRALGSIGANVAEGYSRGSSKDRAHFMNTVLVQPGKVAIGTTMDVTFSALTSQIIGCGCSHR